MILRRCSFLRAVLATLTLVAYYAVKRRKVLFIPHDRNTIILLLMATFLGAAGFWTLLNLSVLFLEPDTSSFLVALYPLLAVVLASIFLHDRMTLPRAMGVLAGIFGTYLIVWFGQGAGIAGVQPAVGIVVALLASFSWAGYMITTRILIGKKDPKTGILLGPEYVTFWTFLIATIPTLLIVLATSNISNMTIETSGFGLVIYLGVFASGVAFLMFNVGMKTIGVSSAAINQLLFPVIAVIISYFLFGELLNIADLLGMGVIIVGIIIAQSSTFSSSRNR